MTNRRSCPSPWVDCSVETGGPPTHRPAPGRSVGCMKPVLWYVLYRRLECLADSLRRSILWAEPAKGVSQFGQTDRGMVAQTIGKQPIDLNRRSTLQHIQVDTGIQKQRPPDCGFVSNPREILIGAALKCSRVLLGLNNRRVPERSNPKIYIRWDAALPADQAGAEVIFDGQARQCQFQQLRVRRDLGALLGRLDQLRRHPS